MPLELVVDVVLVELDWLTELEVTAAGPMTIEVTKGLTSFAVDELARMFRM